MPGYHSLAWCRPTLRREQWMCHATTVAAYRELWSRTGRSVLGNQTDVTAVDQIGHHKRAQKAVENAVEIARPQELRQTADAPEIGIQAQKGVPL